VANTIQRTLASIDRQTSDAYEVILVDDGSTDDTYDLLQKYAEGRSRVTVIHFSCNRGVSAARNAGIEAAGGTYLYFLDGDDEVTEDMVELFLKEASNADVVLAGVRNELKNRTILYIPSEQEDYVEAFFRGRKYLCMGYIVSKDLVSRCNLKYDESTYFSEDTEFHAYCLLAANSVRVIQKQVLRYCYNPKSVTNTVQYNRKRYTAVDVCRRIYNRLKHTSRESFALLYYQAESARFYANYQLYGDHSDELLKSKITKDLEILKVNPHLYRSRRAVFVQLMRIAYKINQLIHG
jgi:glycosyltransferase involved in cell wall biosynthesis